jgi:type IV pilus assembly protein PilM
MGLLREHNEAHPEDAGRDTVLVDIGYKKMLISLFKGQRFVGSRMIEAGCRDIEMAIADLKDVDLHVAGSYRVSNFEDVLDSEQCQAVYSRLIFEISKVVNFYSFSNPDTDIKGIYLSGGGASIDQLVMAMAAEIDFPIWLINTLLPEEVRTSENAAVCSLAYAGLVAGEASVNGN